jgi:glucose-6-phosphate isomerase, archaeal
MKFYPGFDIKPTLQPFGFEYGKDVFGPKVEIRTLDAIRKSLLDPNCDGPKEVYSIAMDVGKEKHKGTMAERDLLYGVVTYAAGRLGSEPVRSQGHIHKKARNNPMSPPEVYEIWTGKAIIYMQEFAEDNPGRCFAVEAHPGEVVIVPPDWAHATISADPLEPLTFGAWCDRNYGFEYEGVRAHKGLAWFPVYNENNMLTWRRNPNYAMSELIQKGPGNYQDLGIVPNEAIYTTFEKNPDAFLYVSKPMLKKNIWEGFVP